MWTPKSPFERRIIELYRAFPPPPWDPAHKLLALEAKVERERDVALRIWFEEFKQLHPPFMLTRMEGGTGFPISNLLRAYFREYASRIAEHGPYSFPTSFNVVESFLSFSHRFLTFDLRDEKEHVLRLTEYFDWYTAGAFPEAPGALIDILPEGLVHLYHFVAPADDFRLTTSESDLAFVGLALVRHATELSAIALLGESPAYPPDSAIDGSVGDPPPGKENLRPDPKYTVADRYLDELPKFARVVAMVRFDLVARRFAVRYINLDVGASYLVETDDPMVARSVPESERAEVVETMRERLKRYDQLLSSLATMIYLPAFFIDQHARVRKTTFATQLLTQHNSTEVQKAIRILGRSSVSFSRDVWFLENPPSRPTSNERTITPPDLEFANSGFWRPLPPGDIGQDESGQPIVGKTWVERTDTWSTQKLESFVLRSGSEPSTGPNAGSIYVMRSGSHGLDLYKIGLTKRTPDQRAAELSSATGVPTPFEVLAKWDVDDVYTVEAEAHRALGRYKVNKRREFFRAPLSTIIREINAIAAR
jgi:hypothetical protein